ncbi:MAG: carbohydrate binding family 9 domain-containing protein, partial [Gemmatimonadetes bacterium]|nr:carbohydrate binding family 9 domain-containing protein [Gemmatimonadota bacterium]
MHAGVLLPLAVALGQHPHAPDVRAVRVAEPPDVDGRLVEEIWQRPPAASSFTQRDPDEGKPATERTEVWVAYDDRALYVAARLYDSEPDRVAARLGRRDDYIESDWFSIGIDSYHDHRTAFQFEVNPAGVRSDGTTSETGFGDDSWDAVWAAAARRDSAGWTAEIEIPFSQLRFTRADTLVWGINLARQIQRKREFDVYAFVPKGEAASISRYAHLVGLVGVRPPRRIELLPYSTARGEYVTPGDPDDPFN